MISKILRLKEKEIKKVLRRSKPFFSYGIVLNSSPNTLWFYRFWIVIWAKSVSSNVTRNHFRRFFYDQVKKFFPESSVSKWYDFVFVVKKEKLLDKKDEKSIRDFAQDIHFLFKKFQTVFIKNN